MCAARMAQLSASSTKKRCSTCAREASAKQTRDLLIYAFARDGGDRELALQDLEIRLAAVNQKALSGHGQGIQLGFGDTTLAQVWFAAAAGIALLALALNTGAALPMYRSRFSGPQRRLESRSEALASYWALYRTVVMPVCALFGIVVFVTVALLATG